MFGCSYGAVFPAAAAIGNTNGKCSDPDLWHWITSVSAVGRWHSPGKCPPRSCGSPPSAPVLGLPTGAVWCGENYCAVNHFVYWLHNQVVLFYWSTSVLRRGWGFFKVSSTLCQKQCRGKRMSYCS